MSTTAEATATGTQIFNVPIATIFAREVLEGGIVILNYRTVILRSSVDLWANEEEDADNSEKEKILKKTALRAITVSAVYATIFAIIFCVALALPLHYLSKNFNPNTTYIVEGVSKLVASVCILQISLKIPVWLNVHPKHTIDVKEDGLEIVKNEGDSLIQGIGGSDGSNISLREIRFNVAWNIWREVAECGVFLIPFFLLDDAIAIPLSAVIGTIVSLILTMVINRLNKKLKSMYRLAMSLSTLSAALALGLFVGGCHLLETVLGSTPTVWRIDNSFWSETKFPMTIVKPFGYSGSRTVLQIVAFWSWTILTILLHYRKFAKGKCKRICNGKAETPTELSSNESQQDIMGNCVDGL